MSSTDPRDPTVCPHCEEKHSINLQEMCRSMHEPLRAHLPEAAVRVTIRKRGVRDAQDRPLYSIVAGGTGLDLQPGEKVVRWLTPTPRGLEGYEERWAIRLSGGRLIECPDEESARRMAESIGHRKAPEKILVTPEEPNDG